MYLRNTGKYRTTSKYTGERSDAHVKVHLTAVKTLEGVRPGVASSPVPAAVKPRFTNQPIDNVCNPILSMALKEKQNQFQKPSSVSLAIKSIIPTNELQDENKHSISIMPPLNRDLKALFRLGQTLSLSSPAT